MNPNNTIFQSDGKGNYLAMGQTVSFAVLFSALEAFAGDEIVCTDLYPITGKSSQILHVYKNGLKVLEEYPNNQGQVTVYQNLTRSLFADILQKTAQIWTAIDKAAEDAQKNNTLATLPFEAQKAALTLLAQNLDSTLAPNFIRARHPILNQARKTA